MQVAARLKALNPLFASVTYGAGGGTQHNTLGVTSLLQNECGYTVMPHLTCVGADKDRLDAFLSGLRATGVTNVLALRGDAPKTASTPYDWSAGKFRHASDLVRYVREFHPDFCVGVAAYPAPHPESYTMEEDRLHTTEKFHAGADFAITQLFFDVREYIDLTYRLKKLGIEKPVIPGVMPIRSFESMRTVLSLCGANVPAKLYISLEEANAKGGAEAVREAGLTFAVEQIHKLLDAGAPGIHLYTLNQADMCLRLADAVGVL